MYLYIFDDGYKLYMNTKIDNEMRDKWVANHGNIAYHKYIDNDG